MALNTFECNCLTPLHFKKLTSSPSPWGVKLSWLENTHSHTFWVVLEDSDL